MEEKIYESQVTKQAISKRVIDEQQIDRHYADNDLAEKEHEEQIYKYHEHDSLLENKEEETLTEEERKAAWEDFENEKTRPPPAPFSAYALQNGMMPGPFAQQQHSQQMAFAALPALLRKDMPNITENQIREMMPLLHSANRTLMQKMGEIYKNACMMNPRMTNAVMNPVPGLFAQQQHSQQMAFAALPALLRKDMPNITENQIREMMPLLHSANRTLMQKMGEIYKNACMMNPRMTNAVMNPVPGLFAQQQHSQQMAFAALAALLRKDMPNITENQIREMMSLLHSANRTLMQKMGEIYKNARMMNPGMTNAVMNPVPGLFAQQQHSQQMAFAAQPALLRKDMPNITENQIREMMSLLHSVNRTLMQKMGEIYKNACMMNPRMTNAVMNPAGGVGDVGGVGGGLALGGSSGLQCESPWQRQQQMRKQQMLQNQNEMGAKYYEGGLGSRDPVAMALQQRMMREMMQGERSRPRGRPPAARANLPPAARADPPPAARADPPPADVVNLDSD